MNTLNTDEDLARRAREVFLASVAGLDARVLKGLREARLKAVEAAEGPHPYHQGWRIPAGAMALVFVGVVGGALWWNGLMGPTAAPEPFNTAGNEDLPIVLTSDSLDMYADLDFYQWLESEDQAKKAPPPPETEDTDDSDDSGVGG